jgi:3-keto-5-aminohexanoate cleavage enzyme
MRRWLLEPTERSDDRREATLATGVEESVIMDPLIITCAPVGAEIMPEQTPHLPYTPALLGETARAVRAAGGSIVHVHCRNDDGSNSHNVDRFREAYDAIRAAGDLIVQFSTGGAIGMTPEERAGVLELRPEMATLTCGSVNFGDDIFENSFPIMRGIMRKMNEFGVRPELEIFDKGHLANARRLAAEGVLSLPQHVDLVLGVPGGLEATVQNVCDLVDDLPAGCTWSVAGVGRGQLPMALAAIAMGGHVRVGLEDNLYYGKGRLARNEELVARVARIAEEVGRPVATPEQARQILGLRSLSAGISTIIS